MRVTIDAELVDDSAATVSVLLGEPERPVDEFDPAILRLTLEEWRMLLHKTRRKRNGVSPFAIPGGAARSG